MSALGNLLRGGAILGRLHGPAGPAAFGKDQALEEQIFGFHSGRLGVELFDRPDKVDALPLADGGRVVDERVVDLVDDVAVLVDRAAFGQCDLLGVAGRLARGRRPARLRRCVARARSRSSEAG